MNKFVYYLCLCVCAWACLQAVEAMAQEPQTKLETVEETLSSKKEEQKALEQKIKQTKKDLKESRKKLVRMAEKVQKSESELHSIEEKIAQNTMHQDKLTDSLNSDRKELARLVMALQKMGRMPKESLLASPETPYKTAQSALLMRSLVPAIQKQAEALSNTLKELETVTQNLENQKAEAETRIKNLHEQEKDLKTLLKKRETLFANTQKDREENEAAIKKIARQAADLKSLIAGLARQREEERTRAMRQKPVYQASVMPKTGQETLPVRGTIVTGFNETDDFGAPSQGIKIRGRGGSLVVAPMGGIVRFAGTFKNYGQMVILEHKKGYHSLVAGLEKIDTVVGQAISAGEPLGRLHKNKALLYYELRKDGSPVNPATRFKDL